MRRLSLHTNIYGTMTRLEEVCARSAELVDSFLQSTGDETRGDTQEQVKLSIAIIEDAFKKHKMNEIAMSFNGGKDCLVMLILFLATLHRYPSHRDSVTQLPVVYVHFDNSFPEVDEFMDECKAKYNLDVVKLPPPLKDGFKTYLDTHPAIKVILVGIRRTDPYGENLTYYERTDHGWPDFIRVHPVLEWHFAQVWDFLRHTGIPYCPLYDQGYTSLGGTTNTRRNPTLKLDQTDDDGNSVYRPAYELTDDEKERLSRIK